jgi:hypothetical protein
MQVNRVSAAVVALAAGLAFAGTFAFDPVPPGLPGLGAVEFPRLVCLVLAGLAALLFVQPDTPPEEEDPAPLRPGLPIYLACLLFVPSMALVGMLGAAFLFLTAAGWLWGERRIALLLAVSAGVTLFLWLVFARVFRLTMPAGLLGG